MRLEPQVRAARVVGNWVFVGADAYPDQRCDRAEQERLIELDPSLASRGISRCRSSGSGLGSPAASSSGQPVGAADVASPGILAGCDRARPGAAP